MREKPADTTNHMTTTAADRTDGPTALEDQGTAIDVLKNAHFRRIFLASFASSTGRWMQNVTLGVFAYNLTGTAQFTTLVIAANLFPLLTLGILGGSLADKLDRRILLIVTQAWQALWGLVLAWQVMDGDITKGRLLLIVLMIGIGQALFAPAFTAVVPSLVGRQNLPAAISLNSAQVNLSRVLGPVLAAMVVAVSGISEVFVINSVTYLLIIAALFVTPIPPTTPAPAQSRKDHMMSGIRVARLSPQVGRPLRTMVLFSLFCLPFIGLLPVIAEENWGIDSEGLSYAWAYAAFGAGAFVGALSAGSVLLRISRSTVVRSSLACFAVALAALASLGSATPVFPAIFFVGLFYFTMPTALSTFLQEHLGDEIRGRVMALWIISFGGILSITNLFSGRIADATSVSAVMYGGSIAALILAAITRLEPGPIATVALLAPSTPDPVVANQRG